MDKCLTNINGLNPLLKHKLLYSSLCLIQCWAKVSHPLNTWRALNWTNAASWHCTEGTDPEVTSFVALGSPVWALFSSFLVWGRGSRAGYANSRVYPAQAGGVSGENRTFYAQWEGLSTLNSSWSQTCRDMSLVWPYPNFSSEASNPNDLISQFLNGAN